MPLTGPGFESPDPASRVKRILKREVFYDFVAVIIVLNALWLFEWPPFRFGTWADRGWVLILVGLIAQAALWWALLNYLPQADEWPEGRFTVGQIRVMGVLALFIWVISFSHDVYPHIPFSLGGGEPRRVVFVLGEAPGQTASFLVKDGAGPQTVPYQLLLESEGTFVVVSPVDGQKAIEFDRKAVAAMIVLGKLPKSMKP